MINDRKPGIKEWSKIRARQKALSMKNYKFWYQTNSGSIVMTEIMIESEALEWLASNQQTITGVLISERMTSDEAYALIKRDKNDDGIW